MQLVKRFLKLPEFFQYFLFSLYFIFAWPWVVWKYVEIRKYQRLSTLTFEEFTHKYSNELKKVRFGCSFAPEMFEDQKEGVKALEFVLKELKIQDIRFGIRWNNTYKNGEIDLEYYDPYLKLLFKHKANICLNVGPIKTFRWPEEHVPTEIESNPGKGSTITLDSPFGREALNYLEELLIFLKKKYKKDFLKNIEIVQPENEGFHNFGVHSYVMSDEYYIEAIKIINSHFPKASILLNSAARLDLKRIKDLFMKLKDMLPDLGLISGYDYYHYYPGKDKFPFFKEFDNLILTSPLAKSTGWNIKQAEKVGYAIEITEAQFEPWFHLKISGNFYNELQFTLLRCFKNILNPAQETSIIRLWGMEGFAKKFLRKEESIEHLQMQKLIKYLNS